jgi:polysaccharide export outer membrane protein
LKKISNAVSFAISFFMFAGCAREYRRDLPADTAVVSQHSEELDHALVESALEEKEGILYRVGPGDSLQINVFRHPEFTPVPVTNPTIKPGYVVDNDGTIQVPLLGSVQVGGLTPEQVRAKLQDALARYIPNPELTVQVMFNGSIRYNLLGEFSNPGLKYADRPMTVLEALALGGTIALDKADLRTAYVARNGKKLPINFYRLLREGDLRQNIRLHTGDTVFVPDNTNEVVFVFGANIKGSAVPLVNGRLNLIQALSAAGFNYTDHSMGKFESVRIIRSEGDRGQFIVVNAEKILNGKAPPFMLVAGDIVFVPETAWTKWNQILNQILPSLQVIANLLSPFVQLKYLGATAF